MNGRAFFCFTPATRLKLINCLSLLQICNQLTFLQKVLHFLLLQYVHTVLYCCSILYNGDIAFLKQYDMSFKDFTRTTHKTFTSKKCTATVFIPFLLIQFLLLSFFYFQVRQNSDYPNLKHRFKEKMEIFHRSISGFKRLTSE